jgi:hypothetical protein
VPVGVCMSTMGIGPAGHNFGLENGGVGNPLQRYNGGVGPQHDGQVNFGNLSGSGVSNAQVDFSGQPPALSDSRVGGVQKGGNEGNAGLSPYIVQLIQQLLQALAQWNQQNQGDTGKQSGDKGSVGKASAPQGNPPAAPAAPTAPEAPAATPPAPLDNQQGDLSRKQVSPTAGAPGQPAPLAVESAKPTPTTAQPVQAAGATAAVGDGPTAGSGPRSFNITNTFDHDITLGKHEQVNGKEEMTGEITLKPGQTGTLKFENDTTGLVKMANAEGKYQADASRLEYYNGFINVSDIDGRNAAIHATDDKGFEIGNAESVADKAPSDIVSTDSGGNETVAGWYDGSTDKMKKGGEFLTNELGTAMTYQHPNDDTLGPGNNPMRQTQSMSLSVTFGKP